MQYLLTLFTPPTPPRSSPICGVIKRASERLESGISTDDHRSLARSLTRATRRQRKLLERSICISNPKSFLAYARKRLASQAGVAPLAHSGRTLTTDLDKANTLLSHFASVFLETSASPDPDPQPRLPLTTVARPLNDIIFSPEVVYKKLTALKKKHSLTPDDIPPLVYKRLAPLLAEPLSILFTRSFEDGRVPNYFRQSIVTPVYENKGSKSDPKNYRRIAQASIPCLIMEGIIADRANDFLMANGQHDPNQHGFIRGRSTRTQLSEVAHFWALSKNQRIPVHCVYFDFSSAFDVCDHDILLRKMASLGLGDRVVTWCRSCLSDRSFCVRVNDSFSPPAPAPKGVPQGSRLGPLLWSIF